jgi:hypothetical protein
MSGLGRLEKVELRDIWKTEAQDFTPWLAGEENLALLSDTLGIDLELEAVEQNVGPFRADILCKDTLSDRWVLVENQLERTDHTHLGQLMTYAAGLDAVTIVWIASRVADEHRAAMDWLNEITDTEVRFFALEVELWRIGESPAAPKFNVVSKPNDWSHAAQKTAAAESGGPYTDLKMQYLNYWRKFEERAVEMHPNLKFSTPKPSQYLILGLGGGMHCFCGISASGQFIRCGVTILGNNASDKFQWFLAQKEEIENNLGFSLTWDAKPDKQRSTIEVRRQNTDPTDAEDWSRQHEWLLQHVRCLQSAFRPHVARLKQADKRRSNPT